jgi:hypothetical protein
MFVKDLAGLGLRPEDLSDFFMAYDFKTCHFSLSKLQLAIVAYSKQSWNCLCINRSAFRD